MRFPTDGDHFVEVREPLKRPIRCDSGTDSTVWMREEVIHAFWRADLVLYPEFRTRGFLLHFSPEFRHFTKIQFQRRIEMDTNFENAREVENTSAKATKKISTRYMAGVAMLSAVAFVLQYFELPIPIMPSFIKFDFSDLPALIGAFAYGPVAGIVIEFIKNLIHCAVSQSATVGELSNFILGAVFAFAAGLIYKQKKSKTNALVGGIIGAILMGLISLPSNYYVVYPFYYNFMPEEVVLSLYQAILPSMKSIPQCLFVFNFPFTVVKGLISVAITMLIYKPLSPILKGKHN